MLRNIQLKRKPTSTSKNDSENLSLNRSIIKCYDSIVVKRPVTIDKDAYTCTSIIRIARTVETEL